MDIPDPLRQAAVMVPEQATSENGSTAADAIDYLVHNEYEMALGILTELGDSCAAETTLWNLLAAAAAEMNQHPGDVSRVGRPLAARAGPRQQTAAHRGVSRAAAPGGRRTVTSADRRQARSTR
ncbi:hypothetical protein FB565_006780 [Actinoplanes lutulentus]|uniref:hypothetical protein n=1 Tax=Actinoplanes lutulentus TaxID=1287878 RepID=UPI0018275700|nr:hypothetical protein [Actinoplanes lutulentus]MBB2947012.1 hypothetical protein [Actinoplanes lutulentus]